jgi:hypothetical protein
MPQSQKYTDTFIITYKLFLVGLRGHYFISNPDGRPCMRKFKISVEYLCKTIMFHLGKILRWDMILFRCFITFKVFIKKYIILTFYSTICTCFSHCLVSWTRRSSPSSKAHIPLASGSSQPIPEAEHVQRPGRPKSPVPCPSPGGTWGCPFSRNGLQCGCSSCRRRRNS